ncbi:bifunctional cytochrome P450/NADPH--P450 reductase [Ahrensia sp. R2A130]|uniref:bifunctional cytochrome P450/NADPH--P450 reductase n=1 Tax=Ahrensia sp. R2A130 TaxID=744979 RepID=UPI0001E0ACD3|nr:cytochrome P450 [Ahrensia sp. R2A130]EFL88452.1 bifunctional P-450:nadph-p450 reductase [Ahrensia sp. R2A130]
MSQTTVRIPTPKKQPFIGNMLSIDANQPLQGLMEMTRELGPIFRMDMMGTPMVIASGYDIVNELCDEARFDKAVRGSLRRIRAVGGDALFTANTSDDNWQKAHRILLPTFAGSAMKGYMPMMQDVATQLCTKWERMNADEEIDVVHDMTAVALDTIGICGFDYRFNSFYRRDYHPFIDALNRTLETCMMQRGLPFEETLLRKRLHQMETDVDFMNNLVDDIIRERRSGRGDTSQKDLLNYMLAGVDKVTGESLSDENIRYQINTFLIAGHETTSGLMSFTLYYLLQHPDILDRCYEEVDRVLGRDISSPPDLSKVNQLTYINQVLSEALRLWPTAPALGLAPYEDEIVGGQYKIKKGTFTTVLSLMLHRDESVWGDDPEAFNPEHFTKEAIAARPFNAYKPFGNGQRACIGRQFAMQEANLVIGMILQRFQLDDHKNYQLKIKESLSIKPDGFTMKVKLRPDVMYSAKGPTADADTTDAKKPGENNREKHGGKVTIAFGSNLGTTEEIARDMARSAETNGFDVKLKTLDELVGNMPKEGALLLACASYNGQPPDNAAQFVDWVKEQPAGSMDGINYALFGCGHSDWSATFQATPRIIDEHMKRAGATAYVETGEGDAKEDLDAEFDTWFGPVWQHTGKALGLDVDFEETLDDAPLYEVTFLKDASQNPLVEQMGAKPVVVRRTRELHSKSGPVPSERSTRHIRVKLAPGQSYTAGDHLSVIPRNSPDLVRRVELRFGLQSASLVRLNSANEGHSALPTGRPIELRTLLEDLVELQSPASRRDVQLLVKHTRCPDSKPKLEALAGDDFKDKVQGTRTSILDLLEEFPACELPFAVYLETCPNMVPRYYSISSSPKAGSDRCSITVAVVDDVARNGKGRYLGTCSNYLAGLKEGSSFHAATRQPSAGFTLPEDPLRPVIMIGPGTGIAPFRGFLQDRAADMAAGIDLGPAALFFGCRHPDQDFIYRQELEAWSEQGVCDLHTAFSRADKERVYVQDVLRQQRASIWPMIEAGAKIYVCGDGGHMEPDVRRALTRIYMEEKDVSGDEADAWFADMIAKQDYVMDVWVSN